MAKPKKITVTRATYNVDLVTNLGLTADHADAVEALETLQKRERPDRLNTSADVRKAAQKVRDLEKELDDSTVIVKLSALARNRWNELTDKHPAREDNEADERFGLNADTFFDEVIPESIVDARWKATGEPVELTADDWKELADEISDVQYAQFVTGVIQVNRLETSVPFSRSASAVTPS